MSQGRQGYLFFDAGSVSHATAGDLVGEDAALEMLSWQNGSFVQSEVEWPRRTPIGTPWQHLLMVAAQRADEGRRSETDLPTDTAKRVVALPSLRPSSVPRPAPPLPIRSVAQSTATVPTFPVVAVSNTVRESSPAPSVRAPVEVLAAVRLGANGEVLAARGQGERLVGLGAYVRRLCDLIGEDLGTGPVQQFQGSLETRHVALFVEQGGSCVAVETAPNQTLTSATGVFDAAGRSHG